MSDDINKMDLKRLRNEVQLLRDELAIMKRKYEDILYNLDTDNFSSRFVKEQGDMKTAIEVTAEGIKTKVSNEEFETAIKQTAKTIESEVKTLNQADEDLFSQIIQTADSIQFVVSKNISAKFQSDYNPNNIETSDIQKGMLCEYNDALYYYNDITQEWKEYPYANGIKSQFLQTDYGFKLTGDVLINGDLITEGTISASRIDTENLSCTRLYSKGYISDGYYAKMVSKLGDFGIYSSSAEDYANPKNENCLWGLYHSDVVVGAVNFYSNGINYLGINKEKEKTFPKGMWDFSSCTVVGLDGVSGTVVAVFG